MLESKNVKEVVIFQTTKENRIVLRGSESMGEKLEDVIMDYFKSQKAHKKVKEKRVIVKLNIKPGVSGIMDSVCKKLDITRTEFINQAIEYSKGGE